MAENRVPQILLGKKKKAWQSLEENRLLFSPQFHNMSACFSTDFSASWVPGGPIEPCTAQGVAAV